MASVKHSPARNKKTTIALAGACGERGGGVEFQL